MAEFLKLAQLINEYGMAKMQIRRGRIEARLDSQGAALLQTLDEFGFDENLFRAAPDFCQLVRNRIHVTRTCRNFASCGREG